MLHPWSCPTKLRYTCTKHAFLCTNTHDTNNCISLLGTLAPSQPDTWPSQSPCCTQVGCHTDDMCTKDHKVWNNVSRWSSCLFSTPHVREPFAHDGEAVAACGAVHSCQHAKLGKPRPEDRHPMMSCEARMVIATLPTTQPPFPHTARA